ncbi:PQ-loop repeat-containing protein [Aspergillus lucknowensis]|uniref:PQ loop repeat-domain-containing protein n=1 Tax=Aspergillus lucknowensis TaxID=176173 RepID=A0ABR4LLU5_9EURO
MAPPLIDYVAQTLPEHCQPTSQFLVALSSRLNICLPTPLALLSSTLGTLSIVSWLFAQIPQIYKNFQLQSTSGLSIFFLIIWCLGDMGNLLGALLTRQAAWQVIIAGYYVSVDITLVVQYFWYTHYKGSGDDAYVALPHSDDDNVPANVLQGVSFSEDGSTLTDSSPRLSPRVYSKAATDFKTGSLNTLNNAPTSYSNEKLGSSRRSTARTGNSMVVPNTAARTVLLASTLCAVVANAAPTESDPLPPSSGLTLEFLGRIFSWMSTVLYLGSRPPQLYKNYRRKSTSGLSPLLFMAAFSGNFFYSASLLTSPNAWYDFPPYGGGGWADADGNSRVEWVGRAIPFFLGAFGVLFLDGFMGVQFLMYGSDDESVIETEDPKRGRSRWTGVHGWMRGWIPSPVRKATSESSPEGQALLTEEPCRYGAV